MNDPDHNIRAADGDPHEWLVAVPTPLCSLAEQRWGAAGLWFRVLSVGATDHTEYEFQNAADTALAKELAAEVRRPEAPAGQTHSDEELADIDALAERAQERRLAEAEGGARPSLSDREFRGIVEKIKARQAGADAATDDDFFRGVRAAIDLGLTQGGSGQLTSVAAGDALHGGGASVYTLYPRDYDGDRVGDVEYLRIGADELQKTLTALLARENVVYVEVHQIR